ncbi:hypothetical protein SBOR_0345 [Sclerotinia borealis F-4128]|uniref:DH domain-containing protein n=1 Tax=Sclerotinia borealis (strain F-4128) TaxID=1432307 RepID=W9CXE0_SCLBF|nr:hypothetical protein SBOR_0345 [Sclerotinia borealis F-4128]
METFAQEDTVLDASINFTPSFGNMDTSAQEDRALRNSINFAPTVDNMDPFAQEDTALRGSIDLASSNNNKDEFGEEVPAHGAEWYANCTADTSIEAFHAAELYPANRITFGTRYTISYFDSDGVPMEAPLEIDEEPVRVRKLMWNRERISEPADTAHLAGDRANHLQDPIELEPNTLEHPKQSAINGIFDINSEVDHPAIQDQATSKPTTTLPVTKYQDKRATDGSFGSRVSNTMRNVAAKGLQVVNDLDEKAATRAQFPFDSPDYQSTDDHITTIPITRRHDKSSITSSLGSRVSSTIRNLAEIGLQVINDLDEKAAIHARFSLESPTPMNQELVDTIQTKPFEKWLHTIKRRGGHRKTASCDMPGKVPGYGLFETPTTIETQPGHRKSLSGSSFGFVSNMKSVGTSLASFSIAPRSRTGMSSRHQRTDFSSRASYAGRASEDNGNTSRGIIMDRDVLKRMEQRQGVIEEILSTEKDYLDDVRALIRVFDGFLITVPILSQSLRKSIILTLKGIWNHNNELYNELVTVVANTNKLAGVDSINLATHPPVKGHKRWQSLGGAPTSGSTDSQDRHIGDPKVAGEIAKVFCGKIPGLFFYESYGIMHNEVLKQINTTYRTTDEWKDLNQAIRSTEEMIVSMDQRESGSQKARDFADYFIKPIHRIARYEVLFGRLLGQSPVCDCPESSTIVETTLFRIKELHRAMNCTTGNHQKATAMSRTWLLQDRLLFTSQPESRSRDKIRTLEQNHLCGVLHACWQTEDTVAGRSVTGQYLIALLYEKFFVLAQTSGKQDEVYSIQACIPISELSVEEVDDGKGLQCHTASYSWKIVFEYHSQLFEIIMSACSAKEELEWKSRLVDRSANQCDSTVQQEMIASLSLDIKPMGTVYGKPGTIARRNSIHRATTCSTLQTTILRNVIIKNTSTTTESVLSSSASQISINRSQSLAGSHRPIILTPPRTERVHLETLLADVWTRDIIPYPGFCSKPQREHTVRASASSMMRKLSHASISSITKRSSSMASLSKSGEDHPGRDAATELDTLRPMLMNHQARQNSSESTSMPLPDLEYSFSQDTAGTSGPGRHGSRLAVIMDEKENSAGTGTGHGVIHSMTGTGSPIMARLASFRSKKSVGSIADTLNSRRSAASASPSAKSSLALPIVTAIHGEELRKENVEHALNADAGSRSGSVSGSGEEVAGALLQAQQRKGRNRTLLVEGFKNLFR